MKESEFIKVIKSIEQIEKLVDDLYKIGIDVNNSPIFEYEVISEGSAGFMGIGAKQAKINARVKEESFEEVEEARKKVKEKEDEEKAWSSC